MIIQKAKEPDHLEVLGVKFYGEMYSKLVASPDRKRFKDSRFIFLNSNSNVDYFLKTFPHAQWEDGGDLAKKEFEEFKKREEFQLAAKDMPIILKDYPEIFKTKPLQHQLKCFEISKDAPFYGLFFEQGCGKTKVVIDNVVYLAKKNQIDSLVIVAPNGVHKNWIAEELPKHCKLEYDAFCWSGDWTKDNVENLKNVMKSNKLKIFSFNIECFVGEKQKAMLLDIIKNNKCLLALDESQTIKNQTAKRTKFFVDKVSKLVKWKRILTGTPVTKGVQDLYTQLKFLSEDIIGISSFYAFKNKYCQMGGFQMKQIIGYRSIDELQVKIQTHTMRVLKKDCLDLPDKLYQKEPFDMTADQLRIYNEIRDEGMAFIKQLKANDEPLTLDNVLTRLKKLQQVAQGYILNIDDKEVVELVSFDKNPRLLKLKELLEKINGKVIIWTIYTQDTIYLQRLLGNEAVRYDGKINDVEKEANKKLFKSDPKIKYLIANTAAMARGHTLTEAETSIYYCNSFDLELRLQSEDRNHRQGTKNNVLYIDLQANKTMDKKIINALRSKKKVADMVLQDPDNLFME
jgi:SNF2 family DNA or RNA helicase